MSIRFLRTTTSRWRLMRQAAATLGLSLAAGCGPAPQMDIALKPASFPAALDAPCAAGGETAPFEGQVQDWVMRVTNLAMRLRFETSGALEIDQIPVGDGYTVTVWGNDGDGNRLWRGVTAGISVSEGASSAVNVLMSRIGESGCTRAPLGEARGFHTVTELPDGRALIVGGARSVVDASGTCGAGCATLEATGSIELYDPSTGTFAPLGQLNLPRLWHTATLLEDGRVLIAGGAGQGRVGGPGSFPLMPVTPVSQIEVIDPSAGSVAIVGQDPGGARVFHSATRMLDGAVLLSGGIPGQGDGDLSNALSSTTVCSGEVLTCGSGPTMKRPRAGHATIRLDSGVAVLFGGSVDLDTVDGMPGYNPESLDQGRTAFSMLETAAMSAARNLFFAGNASYLTDRTLFAGGLTRTGDGTFALSTTQIGGQNRGAVYIFDAAHNGLPALSTGTADPSARAPMGLSAPVFMADVAKLPGFQRAVIAGGFGSLDLTGSTLLNGFVERNLFEGDAPAVGTLGAGGQLREARGGARTIGLRNGVVLTMGGFDALSAGATPLGTTELFTDVEDPNL